MRRWSPPIGNISTAGPVTTTPALSQPFSQAVVRSSAPTRFARSPSTEVEMFVPNPFASPSTLGPYALRSKASAPVQLKRAASHPRLRDNSLKLISFPSVSAGSAIQLAFSPGTMSRSSTVRASRHGNSPCRCIAARAIWWRRGYPMEARFPTPAVPSDAPRLASSCLRGQIEDGALDGQHLEICWLRTPADALAVQIEGSARVRLEDGTVLRINYDAHNGYPFVPAGRVLVEHHLVARKEMSTQRITEWMRENPREAREVRRQNRQVVFFRIVGLDDDREAIGAQGVPLSPGRSIAVDKALHVYGTPFFIEADLPASQSIPSAFRRVLIAQDTGSAIVGPARADLYLGAGDQAGEVANRIRRDGRFTILLPRELDLAAASARMPLPPVKPLPPGKPIPSVKSLPPVKPLVSDAATRASQSAAGSAAPERRRRWRYNYYYYMQ